jgi:hypothetical protein
VKRGIASTLEKRWLRPLGNLESAIILTTTEDHVEGIGIPEFPKLFVSEPTIFSKGISL